MARRITITLDDEAEAALAAYREKSALRESPAVSALVKMGEALAARVPSPAAAIVEAALKNIMEEEEENAAD